MCERDSTGMEGEGQYRRGRAVQVWDECTCIYLHT